MNFFRPVLFPFALIYGAVVFLRNLLYDLGIFESETFDIAVISVGNLSVGGTGKSPHIEYLVRLLKKENKVATLSRGYGRKTSGFILADSNAGAVAIGDEPKQFKSKFPEIAVAVDANRRKGIKKLRAADPTLNVVLLDDAFQHRAVKPGLSILLTDYNHLYIDDFLLPVGKLREWKKSAHRADIIVITRIPEPFSPMEKRIIKERLQPRPYQKIYFSGIRYGEFIPINQGGDRKIKDAPGNLINKEFYFERNFSIVLVTGIANPTQLHDYLKDKTSELRHLKYRDHHPFSPGDIQRLKQIFNNIAKDNKIIVTTEKDAMRLSQSGLSEQLQDLPVFYLPIEIAFHDQDEAEFNEQIVSYVRKNQVNSRIYKKQG